VNIDKWQAYLLSNPSKVWWSWWRDVVSLCSLWSQFYPFVILGSSWDWPTQFWDIREL